MIRSRTKLMSFLKICGIDIRPRIDNERVPAGRDLDAQRIIVSMRASPANSRVAGVEAKIEIAVAHDVRARLRERLRHLARLEIIEDSGANLQQISVVIGAAMHEG